MARPPRCDLSASRWRTWLDCPAKYRAKYVDRRPDPPGPAARIGLLVHRALEEAIRGPGADYGDPVACLSAVAGGARAPVRPEELAAAREILADLAPGHWPPTRDVLGVEEVFELTVGGRWKVAGIVDRLDRDEDGSLVVVDYKSGADVPTWDEARADPQVATYLLALVRGCFGPVADARSAAVELHYVARQRTVRVYAADVDLDAVEAAMVAALEAWAAGAEGKATPGAACGRCPYAGGCRERGEWLAAADPASRLEAGDDLPLVDLADLLRERQRLAVLAAEAEDARKAADRLIVALAARTRGGKLHGDALTASIVEREVGGIDADLFAALATRAGVAPPPEAVTVSVSRTALKKYAPPETRGRLLELADQAARGGLSRSVRVRSTGAPW